MGIILRSVTLVDLVTIFSAMDNRVLNSYWDADRFFSKTKHDIKQKKTQRQFGNDNVKREMTLLNSSQI